MSRRSTFETVMQPASVALDAWFPASGVAAPDSSRRALTAEQLAISGAIASVVARMRAEPEADLLDDLTDEVAALLARAEEIRLALALASRVAR